MRARMPDVEAFVERDGVKTYYEVFGEGERTVLLFATWSIVHSRHWKAQIPYLARHFRVITFDGRGNGKSDRPVGADAYDNRQYIDDAVAVLDATGTGKAVVAGLSRGGHLAGMFAALHPERVEGAVLIAPSVPFGPMHPGRRPENALAKLDSHEGWDKFNVHYWRENYPDFAEFFMRQVNSEPHSTKQLEDMVGWALETTGDVIADTMLGQINAKGEGEDLYRKITCPVLVIHGDDDRVVPHGKGAAVAELTGAHMVTIEGGGHAPTGRDPVKINILLKQFIDGLSPRRGGRTTWKRGPVRSKKALFLPAHAGLGHARRALAVSRELRALHPDLQLEWLTADPVTRYMAENGEKVHPGSRLLLSESEHFEHEAGEHDLHVFQALRRMDEIMVSNFMVFQEAVEEGQYDLIIADEGWDVDYFWHENPELKRGALAWFTDFVGFLPFTEGGEWEEYLTSDYNEEMIEHVERYPWMRDRAIYIGNPEDIVPDTFGPELPGIRDWTSRHFDCSGYISGYDPAEWGDPAELRRQLGYHPDEQVCIVTVGGTGVGSHLIRRIMDAYPLVHSKAPEMRMVVVTGPRIDPAAFDAPKGVELRPYVPELNKHLTVCDLALVQAGLTSCMELTAAKRPFLYFPLKNHFEQNFHVRHRLERYGAGRAMDYENSNPEAIAEAMLSELGRETTPLDVETGGAAKAAKMLSDLL